VAEAGMDVEVNRAAILEIEIASGRSRLFASGLRKFPTAWAGKPQTGALWTS